MALINNTKIWPHWPSEKVKSLGTMSAPFNVSLKSLDTIVP